MQNLDELKLLKTSKSLGTQFVTKLEDNITIFIHNKKTNIVEKINIVKDKRSTDKYMVKSDKFDKYIFVTDGEPQMIYFGPVIIAKVGATAKSRENIYFTVDSYIDLYEK